MDDDFVSFSKEDESHTEGEPSAPALLTNIPAPWLAYLYNYDRQAPQLVRLHNEMLTFCEYVAPSSAELKKREGVLADITDLIHSLWPNATVKVFGSQLTKILTPTSDLDIAIDNVPDQDLDDKSELYFRLALKIRDSSLASYVEAITNAKVPIVKMDHETSGISVDMCINNDSGMITGNLIRKYVREFPPLRPLAIILKIFLSQRRLNDTYGGGVGSFMLTLMIVSFLQMKQRTARFTGMQPSWNLGTLLLEFFQLYGSTFNYFLTGISVEDGGSYLGKRKKLQDNQTSAYSNNNRPNMLYIENPSMPELDVGRSSFMILKVRRAFEHASQVLTAALDDRRCASYLSYVIRPDDPSLQDRPGPDLTSHRSNADALK